MKIKAYAKINLFLDVENKRADGYHNITSIMQKIDLYDEVALEPLARERGICVSMSNDQVACDRTNLAYRAAELFWEEIGEERAGLSIHIDKHIPVAAGLAGGSADAAAVLWGMNELFGRPLTQEALLALGARLGADIPFCLSEGTMLAEGIGEKLRRVPSMPACTLVLCHPIEAVSTPVAYRKLDEMFCDFARERPDKPAVTDMLAALAAGSLEGVTGKLYNIFERVVLEASPATAHLKERLLATEGNLGALMSGSGASVFGIYPDGASASEARRALAAEGIGCEVVSVTG